MKPKVKMFLIFVFFFFCPVAKLTEILMITNYSIVFHFVGTALMKAYKD